ncbi:MAG: hypothetical protein FJ279_38265, partial [Planctomycetes bacterium]|nr:hypothetical protein [Planctomycetota bacterium]
MDWWVASGQWGVMNRWICTPTWSWFGGRSQDIAAIWTKRAFGGDLALDVFASFVMKAYRHFPYERPADLCLTLCGDGRNLSSGYALIVGAENNTVTQLYRRGALVASSRDKAALIIARQSRDPSGVDLHHDWLHLRLTRRGPKVQFELNGTPALSYVDPEPLPEGHVALWTVNNGVLFARVRMAFERQLPPVPPRSDAAEFADAHWTNVRDGLVSAAVQKSADGHIVQSLGSGPVAVQSQLAPVDVAANPILAFDYRIDPGAKVDLYFDLEQMQHRLALTGPKTPPEDVMDIGRLDVAADGRWHRAAIRLHDCLRSQYPDGRSFVVSHLTFGNFSNEGLLLAGFGGNAAGAQYAIRDFRLGPATGSAPPTVARLICPFDEPDNASALVFCLRSEDDAGSDPSDAQIQVNDQSFSLSHPSVRFDFARQRLALDLADAGFALRDGERLRIRVSGLRSRAGVAMREAFEATWAFDQRKDKQGPSILAVRARRGPLATYDFEQGLSDCEGLRPR